MRSDKQVLRRELKARAAQLTKEACVQADKCIVKRVMELPKYKAADTICCFVGTETEIDTVPLILDALKKGKRVGVPRCEAKGIMEVYQITGMEDLVPGHYGIWEPAAGAVRIAPEEIELVIVPCLSCSRDGRRLGYGGGYYDRYLRQTDGMTCVICRRQMMEEDIPLEDHDVRMDVVISN